MEKNNQPLVSIVIPCYNHEQFVQDCIQSVIDQTYENIELIIIDDGSKDDSVLKIQEMLGECENRFINFEFRHRVNKGLSATLNEALEWCRGKYLAPFASDDKMCEFRIEKQVNYFNSVKDENVAGVFGGYYSIDNNNNILDTVISGYKEYDNLKIIMHQFELPAPTALLKTVTVREVGGYRPDIKIEDWFMWLKLTESNGKLVYMSEVLCYYRSHSNNFSKNLDLMYEERVKVLSWFKNNKNYLAARKNIEWYSVTDSLVKSKITAFKGFFKILEKSPFELFSKNMLRFIYYLLKSFVK